MDVLVVATPRHPIAPEQMSAMVDAALAWYGRYQDRLRAFGTFPSGGGFGVVEVDSAEALNQMLLEMPFSFVSDLTVTPFVPGDRGFRQLKAALEAQP